MKKDQLQCKECGCALVSDERLCPVCGASVQKNSLGKHQKQSSLPTWLQKKWIWILGVVVGVALIAGVVCVATAFIKDDSMRKEAADLEEEKNSLISSDQTSFEAKGLGNTAGNIAGGGVIAAGDRATYQAFSEGLYYRDASFGGQDELIQLIDEPGACLNAFENGLYYLTGKTNNEVFTGTSVKCIRDIHGGSFQEEVLYQASGKETLSYLALNDGWLYVLSQEGATGKVLKMACGEKPTEHEESKDSQEQKNPQVLKTFKASSAWLYVEQDSISVITTDKKSWLVETLDVTRDDAAWEEYLKGSGTLASACLHNGKLYYSVLEDKNPSILKTKNKQGGFEEFSDVDGVIRLAAEGDIVVALTKEGQLFWVDSVTGFTHDVSALITDYFSDSVVGKMGIGVVADLLYCRGDKNIALQYGVNSETVQMFNTKDGKPYLDESSSEKEHSIENREQ